MTRGKKKLEQKDYFLATPGGNKGQPIRFGCEKPAIRGNCGN